MKELILRSRNLLRSSPDTVCLERAMLATEGYRRFEHEARPLCRAKTFGHILESMTLDLQTNPVFAGNMSSQPRAWMLLPEYGFHVPEQAPVENPEFRDFLNGKVPAELLDFWAGRSFGGGAGIGHLAVNLEKVLSVGLEGIIAEAEDHQDEDSTRRVYREAMISSCEAVIRWANRYAQAAHEEAAETEEPGARKALLRVAEACRHVPQKPARNLFEALQAIVLVHLAIHIEGHGYSVSPGLLDRLLLPYFEDRGETTELLAAFMLKLSANSLWGSHSKTQAITLGGLDASGRDWCSPLTLRFLEAEDMIRMPDPHLFLRWHEKIDRRVKECTLDLLAAGLSMPSLIGDEQTVSGFIQAGIPEKDAWNYCVIGCNELGIPGKLADSATGPLLNDAAILNETLLPVADPDSISGMEELMRLIEKRMKEYLTPRLRGQMKARARAAEVVPTPFTSALMDGCVKRGQDMHAGMEYSRPALYERGFTNVVNALAAIEHVVFETKSLTLSQLVEALKGNFQDQSIRAMLLRAPKWGSDDDRADRWASAWLEMRDRITRRGEDELGGPRRLFVHVVRSLHHVDGRVLGASPDGRLAGTPLADSIGAVGGVSPEGPTAILNSVMKLNPAEHWQGGYNLNLTLPLGAAEDVDTRDKLIALTDAFFAGGGQELQIAALDPHVLREAKEHPERHPNLLVRVAGFNALFARLSPEEQDELITRAQALSPLSERLDP